MSTNKGNGLMLGFLKRIIFSCYNRNFYLYSLSDSFFRRYFTLLFLIFFVLLGFFGYLAFQTITHDAEISAIRTKLISAADQTVPTDLEIQISDGKLTMNQPSPYLINPEWSKTFLAEDGLESLIRIDLEASVEDHERLKSLVLITQNGVVYNKKKRETQFIKFSEMESKTPLVLNHALYEQTKAVTLPYLDWLQEKLPLLIGAVGFVMSIVLAFCMSFILLIMLLFYSVGGWIISLLGKYRLNYSEVYLTSMYVLIPVMIIKAFFPAIFIGWKFFLLYLVLFAIFAPRVKAETAPIDKPLEVS